MRHTCETVIDSPDIDGMYIVNKSDDNKWYVTRVENAYKHGGQDAREYEHPHGYSSKASAIRWVKSDMDKILEQLLAEEKYIEEAFQ